MTLQVASLKNTIAKKDEEIERLQLLKDLKNVYPGSDGERRGTGSLLSFSSPSSRESVGGTPHKSQNLSSGKGLGLNGKAASDHDNSSEYNDKHHPEEADSQQSMEEENLEVHQDDIGQNTPADDHDHEMLRFGDHADFDERLSDISDGDLSVGTETDGSAENAIFSEGGKSNNLDR